MKLHQILAVPGVFLVSQLALADEQKPDPKVLATAEAIIAYCAKAEPSSVAKYQHSIQTITRGASDETLAKVRKSDAYLQAHASVDEFLAKVDEHNAPKVCSRSLAQSQ
jgi:hypothetical protein